MSNVRRERSLISRVRSEPKDGLPAVAALGFDPPSKPVVLRLSPESDPECATALAFIGKTRGDCGCRSVTTQRVDRAEDLKGSGSYTETPAVRVVRAIARASE